MDEEIKSLRHLQQIAKGRPLKEIAPNLHADTRFYILGLAPNASRISIRFWLNTTFGQLAQNLSDHWQDLAIDPCPWQNAAVYLAPVDSNSPFGQNRKYLARTRREMTRAVINGTLTR